MWVVAERTRRLLCRGGFVALCVVPTLAVICWIVAMRIPGRAQAAAETLASQLGARVTIGSIRHPQPGLTRCDEVEIVDPQTLKQLAHISRLEVEYHHDGWHVVADGLELQAAGDAWWRLLTRSAAPTSAASVAPLWLTAERVKLPRGTLANLTAQVDAPTDGRAGTQIAIGFRPLGKRDGKPVELTAARTKAGGVQVALDTHETDLPEGVVALVLPAATRLGPGAMYRGRLSIELSDGQSSGQAQGRISQLDLTAVCSRLPAELTATGTATLDITAASFSDGRLTQAAGTLRAGPGTLGPRLVDGAAEQLRLVPRPKLPGMLPTNPVAYGQMHFDFVMDRSGLKLSGRCGGAVAGTLVTREAAGGPLLSEGVPNPVPVSGLVRLFSSETTDWVPVTAESEWLLGRLPQSTADGSLRR